jgi:hypothetical protein
MCAHVYVSLLCAATLFLLLLLLLWDVREEELWGLELFIGYGLVRAEEESSPFYSSASSAPPSVPDSSPPLHLFLLWAPRSLLVPRNACVCVSLNRIGYIVWSCCCCSPCSRFAWACVLACARGRSARRSALHRERGMGRACMALAPDCHGICMDAGCSCTWKQHEQKKEVKRGYAWLPVCHSRSCQLSLRSLPAYTLALLRMACEEPSMTAILSLSLDMLLPYQFINCSHL